VEGASIVGHGAPGIKDELRSRTPVSPATEAAPPVEPAPLSGALSRIARIVSETLELKEVFERVAEAAATVLPFDNMGVSRLETPETMRLYAKAGTMSHEGHAQVVRLQDFSPPMRSGPGTINRIDDTTLQLDPAFPMDRSIVERGVRSILRAPLTRGGEFIGSVWFTAARPGVFTADHEAAARPIADLLGLALEHERLWGMETARRRRLDAIDSLLPMMAGTLDVRGIFNRVSETVQTVLPHDRLVLTSLSADRLEVTIDAISGEPVPGLPTRMPAADPPACHQGADYLLIPDVEDQTDACAGPRPGCRQLGIRSLLKIPLRVDGGFGWLLFLSRAPRQYSEEDVVVARRVADHVSLALSHQRLAEEERRAAEARERAAHLEEHVEALKKQLDTTLGYRRVIGESKSWKSTLTQAAKVAPTETTVLLTGESGTGKEVVARFIHRGSPRSGGPFVGLNCAALPETLLESELFGHEKGAFTGATAARAGRIEQAAGGILFLDEVGEMTPAVQAKLLRVLQEREYQRLGGARPIKADVRVVAATNRNLEAALARGEFREDLYYRLRVFEIALPPLRDRRDDILPMAEAFLEEIGSVVGRPAAGISREGHKALLAYPWPGNVRELRNALERATILCDGGLITVEHLPIGIVPKSPTPVSGTGDRLPAGDEAFPPGGVDLEAVERDLIVKALRDAKNNRSRAARLLSITRSQLYYRMQKHGLETSAGRPRD
jgi:Nif-specific regulatory protein